MSTLNLTAQKPVAGTIGDAGQISNGFTAIETVVNALTNANIDPAAAISASKLSGYPSDATKVLRGDGSWSAISSFATPSTSLPGSPTDGQQAILVDSTTAPTYLWYLQYSSSISDAYKWVFLGGTGAIHEVDTQEAIASASYVDAATVGPTLTAPRAGIYDLTYGVTLNANGAGPNGMYASPKIGSATPLDVDTVYMSANGTNSVQASVARTRRKTLAASDVVKLQYKGAQANAVNITLRWMKMIPLRVS